MVQSISAVDVTHRGRVLGEIMDEPARYLTVRETADRLRVTPHTVYRWCRAGRLQAMKIGKEWRIPAQQVERGTQPVGLMPLDELLAGLVGRSEHLLGLASDTLALAGMEATFFEVAAASGARLVHARWEDTAAAVRRRLRPVLRGRRDRQAALHLLQLSNAYEEQDVDGAANLLMREIKRARGSGLPCCIYGSHSSYFGYHVARLTAYECGIHERARGQEALLLCGYALDDLLSLYDTRALSVLLDLMGCHSGIIWFDGQRALLCRPGL